MGIGKGKSDKIDIDNLIGSVNNESKATQEASCLAEKVVELEQATKLSIRLLTVQTALSPLSTTLLMNCSQGKSAHKYIRKP